MGTEDHESNLHITLQRETQATDQSDRLTEVPLERGNEYGPCSVHYFSIPYLIGISLEGSMLRPNRENTIHNPDAQDGVG